MLIYLQDKNCSDIAIFYGTTSVQMSCFMGQQYSDVAIVYRTICAQMLYEATSLQILLCFMWQQILHCCHVLWELRVITNLDTFVFIGDPSHCVVCDIQTANCHNDYSVQIANLEVFLFHHLTCNLLKVKILKFTLNFKSLLHYIFWLIWSSSGALKIDVENCYISIIEYNSEL
jgi:hypothetical protein